MNEENQVYFVDSDKLPQAALDRKHRLEQDPSFRTNHMEYMEGMQVIESDIKDKVLKAMDEFDYNSYTACLLYTSKDTVAKSGGHCKQENNNATDQTSFWTGPAG